MPGGLNTMLSLRSGDPAAAAELFKIWERWLNDPTAGNTGDFWRRVGLPGTRTRQLVFLRNEYLKTAAISIAPDAPTHRKAVLLHKTIKAFAGHQWPAWQTSAAPPASATDTAHLLWHAFRSATHLDGSHYPDKLTKSALLKILSE